MTPIEEKNLESAQIQAKQLITVNKTQGKYIKQLERVLKKKSIGLEVFTFPELFQEMSKRTSSCVVVFSSETRTNGEFSDNMMSSGPHSSVIGLLEFAHVLYMNKIQSDLNQEED